MRTTFKTHLGGTVAVDRNWAQALGVDQLNGVRRVGNFYHIPRTQLMRLNGVPALKWTAQDDRAVAAMLAESDQQHSSEPCLDCSG